MAEKIKIAHIMISASGIDTYVRSTVSYIDKSKFEFVIIQSKNNYKSYEGIIPDNVSYKIPLQRAISPIKDLFSLLKAIRILKKEKPNIIHCHSSKGGVIGRLAGYLLGIKTLYTPHAFSYLSTQGKIKKRIFQLIERKLFFKNVTLLACSYSEEKRAFKDLSINKEQLLTWVNSASSSNITSLKEDEIKIPDTAYICTVGRPSYQKNIEHLIDIFAHVNKHMPQLKLVIAGVGYYSPNLNQVKSRIKHYCLSNNVILVPWTSRQNILRLIKGSECFVSTSRYEGLPYVLIESISLGIPCIATDVDGNKDVVKHGKNGFLIKEDNVLEFSERILSIITDPILKNNLKNGSFTSFKEQFDLEKNIKKLEEIYTSKTLS